MAEYESESFVDAGEPDTQADPETQRETEISEDRLEQLGEALASKRDEWVNARVASGIEKRWLEDYDQYMGRDEASKMVASMMDSAQAGFPVLHKAGRPQRSTVFINITRPKTNTAEARVANMLLPTDDRNFGLKPTPTQELTQAQKIVAQIMQQASAQQSGQTPQQPAQQTGQQPQQPAQLPTQPNMGAVAGMAGQGQPQPGQTGVMPGMGIIGGQQQQDPQQLIESAEEASKAMQDQIDSQFQKCHWNAECRRMIHDSAVLGTGVIKGPINVNRTNKMWSPVTDQMGNKTDVYVMSSESEIHPSSYRVSPWNVYPDPSCGNDIHSGAGIFEKYTYTSKQVRELVKQPGFLQDQIAKVLQAGPDKGQLNRTLLEQRQDERHKRSIYTVWEYWGEFDPDDMRAAGVEVPDGHTELISGCIIMINDVVVKGFLNPLDTGDIPFDFYPWELDEESCWGYGVPYLCRPAQKVLTAAWRQLMDNSGNTIGPQVILKPQIIQPADGQWVITGNKIWNCVDPNVDVRTAFQSVEINNHAEDLERIINLAKQFADDESMVPQLVSGEHDNAPDTVGGMTILMNSINVVLGRLAKQFDDYVITRHVNRYIDWNMAYSDKPEIKGNHDVQARGTSALLVRDIQNQTLIQFGQFQQSGIISPMVNWEAWIKAVLKAQHVDPTEILKTDAEITALQNAPPQATPEQIKAQTQLQIANIRAGAALKTAGIKQQGEMAYAEQEASMAHDNHIAMLQKLQLQRDLALLTYAQQHNLKLIDVQAQLQKTQMQEETKRQLAATGAVLQQQENHAQRMHEIQQGAQIDNSIEGNNGNN